MITRSLTGTEFLWMLLLGLLTTTTGCYLTYRTLLPYLNLRRGHATPIFLDERTTHILNRAARNAFIFLLITTLMTISLLITLQKWGAPFTWTEPLLATMTLWVSALTIFYGSIIFYDRK